MSCEIFVHRCGVGITGSASTLSVEYSFFSNGIWFGFVYVYGLALHLILGVGAASMVTDYSSTFGDGLVLFFSCSTILA